MLVCEVLFSLPKNSENGLCAKHCEVAFLDSRPRAWRLFRPKMARNNEQHIPKRTIFKMLGLQHKLVRKKFHCIQFSPAKNRKCILLALNA